MTSYRVTRTEKIAQGEDTFDLVAGQIRDDLPDSLVEAIGGEHGGLEEATDEEIAEAKAVAKEEKAAAKEEAAATKETHGG